MIIDNAIKTFVEKYDREAMDSISVISKDLGLVHNKYTLKGFNITEAFNKYQEYIKGYAQYKVENKDNSEASPQNVIIESVKNYINTQIFQEKDMLYNELPAFVESYVNGVNNLLKTVDEVKHEMMENGVNQDDIGNVNDFTDDFMVKLHESFDPTMDRILRASGYTTNKNLFGNAKKEKAPVFL